MAKPFEKVAGLATTVLVDFERKVDADASSIQPDGVQAADESESTIELILTEGDEETVTRISVSRTHD